MIFLLKKTICVALIGTALFSGQPAFAKDPELIYFDYTDLVDLKKSVKAGDKELLPAYEKLISHAKQLLSVTPEKVTDGDVPPSGDIHDFFAIGKLAFPNPKTADGMPYVRRDGVTNPEADGARYDLSRYNQTLSRINDLSLAWFFSGDERYAKKAAELIRVWFIAPETRMNPNLNNASALPGVYAGMPIGIIFSVALIKTVDHVKLLESSKSWGASDDQSLKKWFRDYTTWLLESDLGVKEAKGTNNHGSWYAAQVAAFSLYSGDPDRARPMMALVKKQIDQQITPVGSMPRELSRQRSLHYSVYGLQAFTMVARCGDYLGENIWTYKTADGRGLELAFHFLSPYLLKEKEWTWTDIEKGNPPASGALEVFSWASKKYDVSEFKKTSKSLYEITKNDTSKARLTIKKTS